MSAVVLVTGVPVEIDRDAARAAAEAELAKAEYRQAEPSLPERVVTWLLQRIGEFFDKVSGVTPGGGLGLLVLLGLLVVLAVVIRLRVGKFAREARGRYEVFAGATVRTAEEFRQAAEKAFAEGDFTVAVRERFRAVVRTLEERELLDERSGRTADEAAAEAGARLPALNRELRAAAVLFDTVHYGGHHASPDEYRTLAALDERCRTERPAGVVVPG